MRYVPWIIIALLLYNMLPSEESLRERDSEARMYRITIRGLESQIGDLGLQLRMRDLALTECKNRSK